MGMLKNCCCCGDLKSGTFVFSVVLAVLVGLGTLKTGIDLAKGDEPEAASSIAGNFETFRLSSVIGGAVKMIVLSLVAFGIRKEKRGYLWPALVLIPIIYVLAFIAFGIFTWTSTLDLHAMDPQTFNEATSDLIHVSSITIAVICFLGGVFYLYYWMHVYSVFIEMGKSGELPVTFADGAPPSYDRSMANRPIDKVHLVKAENM